MYDVKDLIEKMKLAANINTNTDLAKELNVSYNTLNTWLKRKKLPQEVILNFANRYNISLDYLLLNKKLHEDSRNSLFSTMPDENSENNTPATNDKRLISFTFYGEYEPLNIKPGNILELDSTLLHSNGHYLLKYDDIFFIAKVVLNIYTNRATVITSDNSQNYIDINSFKAHKIGIITDIK